MLLDLLPLEQPPTRPARPSGPIFTRTRQPSIQRGRGAIRIRVAVLGRAITKASWRPGLTVTTTVTAHPMRAAGRAAHQVRPEARLSLRARARQRTHVQHDVTARGLRHRLTRQHATATELREVGIRHPLLPWPLHELLYESWDR